MAPDPAAPGLVGGDLALDFANTAGGRQSDATIETLRSAADLVAWAAHAGVPTSLPASNHVGRDALDRAIALREAIHRVGSALATGRPPAVSDLASIRDVARAALASAPLSRAAPGDGFDFDFSGAPTESALLGPIAWSAIEVLRRGGFERLKRCPGHDCGWLFYDRSKNNSRRWCDMATCGNRVKARRARAKAG